MNFKWPALELVGAASLLITQVVDAWHWLLAAGWDVAQLVFPAADETPGRLLLVRIAALVVVCESSESGQVQVIKYFSWDKLITSLFALHQTTPPSRESPRTRTGLRTWFCSPRPDNPRRRPKKQTLIILRQVLKNSFCSIYGIWWIQGTRRFGMKLSVLLPLQNRKK